MHVKLARSARWREATPPLLVQMVDVSAQILRDEGGLPGDVAEHLAYEIIRAQADAVGGGTIYMPVADSLIRHDRDQEIWQRFTGNNTRELAREYGITVVWASAIIRRMRAADVASRQGRLSV